MTHEIGLTWEGVVDLALRLPGTVEGVSYGEPSLKVGRGLLTRLRVADGSLVVLDVPPEERAMLIDTDPAAFFLEPHYEGYDIVLARLSAVNANQIAAFLERRWRSIAPRRAVEAFGAERGD